MGTYANDTHKPVHVSAFYDALVAFFLFPAPKIENFPTEVFLPATDDDLHFMDVFGEPKSDYRSFWQNIYADLCRLANLHNLMNFAGAGGGKCGFQVRLMHLTLIVQSISESFVIGSAKFCRRFSVWWWYHCQFHPGQELNIREFPSIPFLIEEFQETVLAQWLLRRASHSKFTTSAL